jgi:hypothetical protein
MTKAIILCMALLSTSLHANEFNYNQGVEDGCQSGKDDIFHPFKKDIELYVKDAYYKTGWDDAFIKCKSDSEKLDKIIKESFGW